MKFNIMPTIFDDFPHACIGVVIASQIQNRSTDAIAKLLRETEQETAQKFEGAVLSTHPTIHAWRRAYKTFGAGDYRSSVENLTKRVIKGGQLPTINPLVDLYNVISLRYTLPVGGEDLSRITGDILLTRATGNEQFIPLLETENNPPLEGEIIYKDDVTVLCRKWNWRESDVTKLTHATDQAIFFIEGLLPEERERIAQATTSLAELLQEHCQATTSTYLVDQHLPTIEFRPEGKA